MGSSSYLAAYVSGQAQGQVRVGCLVGGHDFVPIGGPVGTNQMESPVWGMALNSVINYKDNIYVWVRNKIYKYDEDSDTWPEEYTLTGMASTATAYRTGLHTTLVGGVTRVVGMYQTPGGYRIVHFDGTTWTDAAIQTMTELSDRELVIIRHMFFMNQAEQMRYYDPDLTYAFRTHSIGDGCNSLFVLDGELFLIGKKSATNTDHSVIWKYGSGTFYEIQSLASVLPYNGQQASSDARPGVFVVGSTVYAFLWGTTDSAVVGSVHCLKLTRLAGDLFNVTDITSTVAPLDTFLASETFDYAATPIMCVAVDSSVDPANPIVDLWYSKGPGMGSGNLINTSWAHFRWNGESSPITYTGDTDPVYGFAVPHCPFNGAGDRVWHRDSVSILATAPKTAVLGGMRYTFMAYGDPTVLVHGSVTNGPFAVGDVVTQTTGTNAGATGTVVKVHAVAGTIELGGVTGGPFENTETIESGIKSAQLTANPTGGASYTVKLYHSAVEQTPTTQSTLTGSATGGSATRSGNQVNGVVADGFTQYTCIWDFAADGLPVGKPFTDLIRIAATV